MPYVTVNKNPRTKIIIGTLLVLLLAVFILIKSNLDPKQIINALSQMDAKYLALALGMNLLQVLFWILRPWPLIPKKAQFPFLNLAKAISIGQFLNAFAPARAGDVTKVFLLSSQKIKNHLKPTTAVGLLAADKLVDLIAVLLLAFVSGATAIETANGINTQFSFSLLLFIPLLFIFTWLLLKKTFKEKIKLWFYEFLHGIKPLLSPKAFLLCLIFALCVWISEALAILMILKASGVELQFSQSVYLMCIVNLGILVPVSFANVGAYEAAFVYGVSKFNIGLEAGVALAIAQHALQALAMSLWAIAMFRVGKKVKIDSLVSLQ